MITREAVLDEVRPRVVALVNLYANRLGAKMQAYAKAAKATGTSARYLEKIVGRAEIGAIPAHVYFNIVAAYERLCLGLEHEASNDLSEIHQHISTLRGQHATFERAGGAGSVLGNRKGLSASCKN